MGYKTDTDEIRKQVKYLKEKYNFDGVLHFTDFLNFKRFLEEGYLYSRNDCKKKGINFIDGANHSVIDRASSNIHNCVRFYYRSKTPTLYDNEGIKLKDYCNEIHIPIPVYLLFDEELLYLDDSAFTDGNATNSEIGSTAVFFNNMDWNSIFHNTWFDPGERDYIINKRQAELLSCNPVNISYLKKIIFRCNADKKRAINLYGDDKRYEVDIRLFSDKNSRSCNVWVYNNFINDYHIEFEYDNYKNKSAIKVGLKFQKPFKMYETTLRITGLNGECINEFNEDITNVNDTMKILRLKGDIANWLKLDIYMNDFLCIEEFLIKYDIIAYNIKLIYSGNKYNMVLYKEYINNNFLKYKHRVEILDINNKMIYKSDIQFNIEIKSLAWNITFSNYDNNWFKIKYYMNDALCICDEIKQNIDYIPF